MDARSAPSIVIRMPAGSDSGARSGASPTGLCAPSMELPLSCGVRVLPIGIPRLGARSPCRYGPPAVSARARGGRSGLSAVLEDALGATLRAGRLGPRGLPAQHPLAVRPALDLPARHQLPQCG